MALARLGTAPPRVLFLGRSEGGWYHGHAAVSTIYRPAPAPIDVPSVPAVRLIPLGGLGEIGLNMMLVESGDDVIAVDCGLLFPDDEMPGVDYVIPDFSYLRDRRAAFRGVVLTHGHEDHIGALSYLLRDFDVPVYGTPLTLAIAKHRLAEHGVLEGADLRVYGPGDEIVMGGFTVSPIRVTHSIADGIGLAIETAVGTIVHTGDFKLDQHPVDDQQADYRRSPRWASAACWPSARTRPMSAARGIRARRPRWARPSMGGLPRRRAASSWRPSPRTSTASSSSSTSPPATSAGSGFSAGA